jgi:hypothetical protein
MDISVWTVVLSAVSILLNVWFLIYRNKKGF